MNATLAGNERPRFERSSAPRSTGWRKALTTVPAIAVALLPKCPACLPGFGALASSLGLSILIDKKSVLALTAALLILAVIGRGLRINGQKRRGPLAFGAFGALIVFTGKLLDVSVMSYAGALSLIAGSLWNIWLQRIADAGACPRPSCCGSITGDHKYRKRLL